MWKHDHRGRDQREGRAGVHRCPECRCTASSTWCCTTRSTGVCWPPATHCPPSRRCATNSGFLASPSAGRWQTWPNRAISSAGTASVPLCASMIRRMCRREGGRTWKGCGRPNSKPRSTSSNAACDAHHGPSPKRSRRPSELLHIVRVRRQRRTGEPLMVTDVWLPAAAHRHVDRVRAAPGAALRVAVGCRGGGGSGATRIHRGDRRPAQRRAPRYGDRRRVAARQPPGIRGRQAASSAVGPDVAKPQPGAAESVGGRTGRHLRPDHRPRRGESLGR